MAKSIPQVKIGNEVYEIKDTKAREQLTNLNSAYNNTVQKLNIPDLYANYYGHGYFNSNLEWAESATIVTFRFHLPFPSFLLLFSDINMSQKDTFQSSVYMTLQKTNGTLERNSGYWAYGQDSASGQWYGCLIPKTDTEYIYMSIPTYNYEHGTCRVVINTPLTADSFAYKDTGFDIPITKNNFAWSQLFVNESSISILGTTNGNYAYWLQVNAGDEILNIPATTLSYKGAFRGLSGNNVRLTASQYTCPEDGYICIFDNTSNTGHATLRKANRQKILISDISDYPSSENLYDDLSCVAFGTSLTERSATTGGYLTELQSLSGMVIDNQGLGSSVLLDKSGHPSMFNKISAYTSWSDKDVCILEGFVNDWRQNPGKLGTWKDVEYTTVCGMVRRALNYIAGQKRGIKIFLMLDHYGRSYEGHDSSSTALNDNNETQYEWWTEISKVAESLGIPVIASYALSQIGENNPQYLLDNIHLNPLGAQQEGAVVWSVLGKQFPNKH